MGPANGRSAVCVDRDGVLNDVVVQNGVPLSPRRANELHVVAGSAEAIQQLRRSGLPVFVASNQPDVARGRLAPEELARITAALQRTLPLDDVAICPHDDADGCTCRKPQPGLLVAVAERWGVDLSQSYMVGDSWKDVEAGRRGGWGVLGAAGRRAGGRAPARCAGAATGAPRRGRGRWGRPWAGACGSACGVARCSWTAPPRPGCSPPCPPEPRRCSHAARESCGSPPAGPLPRPSKNPPPCKTATDRRPSARRR